MSFVISVAIGLPASYRLAKALRSVLRRVASHLDIFSPGTVSSMPKPIRLLQLAKHFDPDPGGIETVTLNISEALLHYGIQADVLCTEVKGPYHERDRGYRVIRCKTDVAFGNKRLSWRYVERGMRLQRDYDAALVHIPNPLAVLAALGWHKPVIPIWHADIPQAPIRRATAAMDRRLLAKAAAVIGPTPVHLSASCYADRLVERGTIIPYPFNRAGIPTATGATAFAERLRIFRAGRLLSISIGRLVPYKGFDVLIEAARMFGNGLAALIVGSGPLEEQLRAQIRDAGVEDRVLLAGGLSPAELADAFAQASFGCMPSVTAAEMYGIAQVESMAAGLPMVSTAIPRSGVPYVNKDGKTGLVVPPGDAPALATSMRRMATDDELRQSLSAGALHSIATDHDIGPVGERYAALIRKVVAGSVA